MGTETRKTAMKRKPLNREKLVNGRGFCAQSGISTCTFLDPEGGSQKATLVVVLVRADIPHITSVSDFSLIF